MPIKNHEDERPAGAFRENLGNIPVIGDGDNLYVLQKSPEGKPDSNGSEPRNMPEPALSGGDTGRLARVKLEEIATLSQRTKNVLLANAIPSIKHLCDLSPIAIEQLRQGGIVTQREMLQAMLQRFIRPTWASGIARTFRYDLLLFGTKFYKLDAPDGYNPVTTYYDPSEYWMLEVVIADMVRGGIDWCLVRYLQSQYALYRKGGLVEE